MQTVEAIVRARRRRTSKGAAGLVGEERDHGFVQFRRQPVPRCRLLQDGREANHPVGINPAHRRRWPLQRPRTLLLQTGCISAASEPAGGRWSLEAFLKLC